MDLSNREVVVTGIGVVTSNGVNASEFQDAVIHGKMGIKKTPILELFPYSTSYGGWIDDGINDRWEERFIRISRNALDQALNDAKLTKKDIQSLDEMASLYLGSANLGSLKIERQLSERFERNLPLEDPLDFNTVEAIFDLVNRSGVRGKLCQVDAACASGKIALGEAFRSIQQGEAALCVVGGTDVFSDLSLTGFDAMNNLDDSPCKPFDKNRNGITIGEGAAVVILEERDRAEARGAKIYGKIFGYHTANDAYHVTAPDPTGQGAAHCMEEVIKEWDSMKSVLYVNTHGTATKANDEMELKAMEIIQQTFQFERIYFSSTKSLIGHTLGASGLIEFIASVLALEKEKFPVSISVTKPMEYDEEHLTLVTEEMPSHHCNAFISNSFAFAGNSATIGFEKIGG